MELAEIIQSLYLIGGNLAVLCLTITTVIVLTKYKNLEIPFKRLLYFLLWNLFIEVLARVFTYAEINNLPLLHVYTIGEFILFSWFYKSLLIKPIVFQNKFWHFIISGAFLIALNSLLFHSIYEFNPLGKTFVQIIIISYAVLYFYNLTETQSNSNRVSKSLSLINSAVLIYYSGSLFIFMCSQALGDYPEWITTFWGFNAVLNLIFQLLIFFGIWKVVYRKTPSSS
jgi:hypothetical protein